jgi:hypothetical protein
MLISLLYIPMKLPNFSSLTTYLINALYIQLFMMLISLPLFCTWGLPLSLLSPVGNSIFVPFITMFLLTSSLILFTTLLDIPNSLFIFLLEQLTKIWFFTLQLAGSAHIVLISFPKSLTIPFIFLALCGCILTLELRIRTKGSYALLYALLLCIAGVMLVYAQYATVSDEKKTLPCCGRKVTIYRSNGKTCIVDSGSFGRNLGIFTWIDYTLLPTLRKEYGSTHIEHLVLLKPSTLTFDVVALLCTLTTIRHVYLVYWEGTAPELMIKNYRYILYLFRKYNITLHRIPNKAYTIDMDSTLLSFEPNQKTMAFKEITYQQITVDIKKKSNVSQN